MTDTIFALSSGSPPAAIAVMRVSGPQAAAAICSLAGSLPKPRRASYRALTCLQTGEALDRALGLWFPGPNTSTGEDLAEFHLHGGRAVVAGVASALGRLDGLRPAAAGEFTRRAFENGRIDLAEAEGLADLLAAETASQRTAALHLAGGALSRRIDYWQAELLRLSARVEAELDFSDEGDVAPAEIDHIVTGVRRLAGEMRTLLEVPSGERLKDGISVVLAGPVNAGKSSLINALAGRDLAITSDIPGTTRDLVEAPVSLNGMPFRLIDTAGLRESADEIEAIGVERARRAAAQADIILWLGDAADRPSDDRCIVVASKCDLGESREADLAVSSLTGQGLPELVHLLVQRGSTLLPHEGEIAMNARHRQHVSASCSHLEAAGLSSDMLIIAEELRLARRELDSVTGRAGVEQMLDALFGSFCIGK